MSLGGGRKVWQSTVLPVSELEDGGVTAGWKHLHGKAEGWGWKTGPPHWTNPIP
jgi:hypothetical protein